LARWAGFALQIFKLIRILISIFKSSLTKIQFLGFVTMSKNGGFSSCAKVLFLVEKQNFRFTIFLSGAAHARKSLLMVLRI
jgi:hypothetical protein